NLRSSAGYGPQFITVRTNGTRETRAATYAATAHSRLKAWMTFVSFLRACATINQMDFSSAIPLENNDRTDPVLSSVKVIRFAGTPALFNASMNGPSIP